MFKWHVHSAIGRSRPVAAADISRVVDGIAASLRQFSVSVARSADGLSAPSLCTCQDSMAQLRC
jgi:hypothetical protein